jgi:hypothetical protein
MVTWRHSRRRMRQQILPEHRQVHGAAPLNGFEILDKLSRLPVSTWRYEWETEGIRHLGPMAQDFAVAFGLGDDDCVINHVDANGVLMVSVQALHRRVQELETRLAALEVAHRLGDPGRGRVGGRAQDPNPSDGVLDGRQEAHPGAA